MFLLLSPSAGGVQSACLELLEVFLTELLEMLEVRRLTVGGLTVG